MWIVLNCILLLIILILLEEFFSRKRLIFTALVFYCIRLLIGPDKFYVSFSPPDFMRVNMEYKNLLFEPLQDMGRLLQGNVRRGRWKRYD
jgi:hypothetical protein